MAVQAGCRAGNNPDESEKLVIDEHMAPCQI